MKRYIVCILALLFSMTACGGSGSGNPAVSGKGTVALYVKDGPTDDYEHIWVWVKTISLLPQDNGSPVTVFESDEADGYKIDLLDLKDQDMLLTLNDQIPVGTYAKIRMAIGDIQPEGGTGECTEFDVKLPSGKIDLIPDQPFTVSSNETLSIRLDIDAEKSINLHTAGSSEKCIFRPVVFVDIVTGAILPSDCPINQTGTLEELVYETDSETVVGFKLELDEGRGLITVTLDEGALLFNSSGEPITSAGLETGQTVFVRGQMTEDNSFEASLAVIGGLEMFKGTVGDSGETAFTLNLAGDSGALTVSLTSDTQIFRGCDDAFEGSVIPEGATAKAFGKFVSGETPNEFRALLVLFEGEIPQVTLTVIESTEGGYLLAVQDAASPTYVLPDDATVRLEGDGPIDMSELTAWVACQSRPVTLKVADESADPPVLSGLVVLAEQMSVTVDSTDTTALTISTADGTISVKPTATLLKLNDGLQTPMEFDEIEVGDDLTLFGLTACDDNEHDIVFYTYILMVMP